MIEEKYSKGAVRMNPAVHIDLKKLRTNIEFLTEKIRAHNLSITHVTKAYSADPEIIKVFEDYPEIEYLGDSRIENLKSYALSSKKKILIRIPMISEAQGVVKYADISFNSELTTIQALNEAAKAQGLVHQILLMVDLGDLREGYFKKDELFQDVKVITETLPHIQVIGLGVNLTCYGAIIPEHDILKKLVDYKEALEASFPVQLTMISGGNSSSLYLLDHPTEHLPQGINNLRIGESYLLGRETAFEQDFNEMFQNVFTLRAEIVELKTKPSFPIGNIGVDAFGNKPFYEDKGPMKRGIVAIGKQDIHVDSLTPIDPSIQILGASSDHLILDLTHSPAPYQVGDTIEFNLSYGGVLSAFTSKYVKKVYHPTPLPI